MIRTPLSLLLVLAACSNTGGDGSPAGEGQAAPEPRPELDLGAWVSEHIPLPPEFAPGMPPGEELLLFAPGMFEAEAEDYWSYVFVMRVEGELAGLAALEELFEAYYDGLIQAVGASKGESYDDDVASVTFQAEGGERYAGEIQLVDAFVTMEPLQLRVIVDLERVEGGARLEVQASPQPADHEIWRDLAVAVASIEL